MKYTTLCPLCQKDGKKLHLQYDLGTEVVFCDNGHKWPTLADAEEFAAKQELVEERPEQVHAAAEESEAMEILDKTEETNGMELDALPPPISLPPPVVEPIVPKKETKKMTEKKTAQAKVPPPSVARALEKMNGKSHDPVVIEGGAMLVTLKIDDQFVSAVKQEAENQGMTLQEHLQNVFGWGMESGWFCILVLTVLLFVSSAYGQTAKVLPLKPADTVEARAKWDALQKAQADWDALQKRIQKDYTLVLQGDPDASNEDVEATYFPGPNGTVFLSGSTCNAMVITVTPENEKEQQKRLDDCDKVRQQEEKDRKPEHFYRKGWEGDIDFDKDFKFIVPKSLQATPNPSWGICGGGIMLTPSTTTTPAAVPLQYQFGDFPLYRITDSNSSARVVTPFVAE
jgi:hypothetical protein